MNCECVNVSLIIPLYEKYFKKTKKNIFYLNVSITTLRSRQHEKKKGKVINSTTLNVL